MPAPASSQPLSQVTAMHYYNEVLFPEISHVCIIIIILHVPLFMIVTVPNTLGCNGVDGITVNVVLDFLKKWTVFIPASVSRGFTL